jgi:serine/threonine protein kinase
VNQLTNFNQPHLNRQLSKPHPPPISHSSFNKNLPQVSAECRQFVEAMLTVDATARPRAMDLLEHPWLVNEAVHGNLLSTKDLKKYRAKQRFRKAVKKVQAVHR